MLSKDRLKQMSEEKLTMSVGRSLIMMHDLHWKTRRQATAGLI